MVRHEKTLGTTHGKHRYDLPLNKDAGTGFLILLIALMSFLATMALASSFTLSAMADRWTSGLENRMTVEIPAQDDKGNILKRGEITPLAARIAKILESSPSVSDVHILSENEISDLVSPWLGKDMSLDDMPLPGLIAVETRKDSLIDLSTLEGRIVAVAPQAKIDTHQSWLKDVLRFTGALQFAATLLTAIIGITTVTAVAGAIRSRMAVHHEEVSLLHLMGASDSYIARQFQHHSLILTLKGASAGMLAGGISLWLIGMIAGKMGVSLLPDFHLGFKHISMFALLPPAAAVIAVLTARHTVHNVLGEMP